MNEEEPLQEAEVIDFPHPDSKAYMDLKLRVYRKDNIARWGVAETEIFDSACSLFDMGLIHIWWVEGEPMFQVTQAGINLTKPVQMDE